MVRIAERTALDLNATAIVTVEKQGLLTKGDLTVITSGVPIGMSGTTNMIKVRIV